MHYSITKNAPLQGDGARMEAPCTKAPRKEDPWMKTPKDKTPKRQKPQRQKPQKQKLQNICLTCSNQKWLGHFLT